MLDLSTIPLVDHHCHGVVAGPLERPGFVRLLTKSRHPVPHGASWFDTQLGFAVRACCPPLLDLAPHASPEEYLTRRAELGADEVTGRLLKSTGITEYLVDTGLDGSLLGPTGLALASGARTHETVRLETLAEQVLRSGTSSDDFVNAFAERLDAATATAVAVTSIVAYRSGLDLDPARPSGREVRAAAGAFLAAVEGGGAKRVTDPVLLRHLLWTGLGTGLPLQVHAGLGDADLTLHQADPALLTPFLRAAQSTAVPVILLHNYPYHRNAAYLAHVFPHVYVDLGLTLTYVGTRAGAVLGETLELAPFAKVLFSTGAYGLPELYVVAAALFREHLQRVLAGWVARDACTEADAERVAWMIASENAEQVYLLTQR